MKRILAGGLLLCLLLYCAGCGQTEDPSKETPVIGYSIDSLIIERWQRDRDVFVSAANQLGAEVDVQDAGGDVDKQIDQIRELIHKQVQVIVVVASDCDRLSAVIREASENGIQVICYDRLVKNAPVDLYLSVDSQQVGRLMGECIRQNVPEDGKIICVFGSTHDSNTALMRKGFQEAIEGSGIQVIRSEEADDWVAERAYEVVSEELRAGQQIDAVMCGNDDLAGQAFQALSEYQKAGQVVLVGQDAELAACQRIAEGTQTMTVYKPFLEQARLAAEYAVQLIQGQTPETNDLLYNGSIFVPSYMVAPTAVTEENLDDVIIQSGFHSSTEVYRNISEKQDK